jgi:hypothetical protein
LFASAATLGRRHAVTTITPGFPTLKQVKIAGDFERVLSFGIGVDHRTGFRVLPLTNPSRVAIDLVR